MRACAWPKPQVRFLPPRNSHTLVFVLCVLHMLPTSYTLPHSEPHTLTLTHMPTYSHTHALSLRYYLLYSHIQGLTSRLLSHTLSHTVAHTHTHAGCFISISPL